MGICSLALAPLGCGNGGLEWTQVKPLVEKYLGDIPNLEVFAYVPNQSGKLVNTPQTGEDIAEMPHHKLVSHPETTP